MLHEERILKHKFAYFFTIIFVFAWIIYYGAVVINILLKGYRVKDEYTGFEIPYYSLTFIIFTLLIMTFISIFKESNKMFLYLNISMFLIMIAGLVTFYAKLGETSVKSIYSLLITIAVLVIGPAILINYLKHNPAKSEIEDIGKHKD
ncbi:MULTISPECIES: hypothetical protein [unclassified Chryseobacterium]|uniref:hypothetical protein n=1 Tax=unclassified Chryseobacterium TaxID=2593645 RepID=UPI0028534C13|nr:hypothetical protein [Chryseobacterium sp. CFS7]MDR4890777.1 hypothetical protein [Chryseobacterium sp. CFS7]